MQQVHYWISTYPFFSHSLLVAPPPTSSLPSSSSEADQGYNVSVDIFDADGMLTNHVEISRRKRAMASIELDSLLGGCKIESGIKHCHLVASVPEGFQCICRLVGPTGSSIMTPGTVVSKDLCSFLPLTFSSDRTHLLAIINTSAVARQLRCRLYCGKRTPEVTAEIPGNGVRLLSIQSEFSEFAIVDEGKRLNAYARLTSASDEPLFVQMVERYELQERDVYRYSAVS